jgi:preprotein translocase subunit YajC
MGELTLFLPLIIIMGAFMFFASRRQKKAMQATISLHDSLAVGDEIMTTAGVFGTIAGVGDSKVEVELAPGVVVTMLKLAVKEKITADADDDLDDEYDDEYEDDGDGATDGDASTTPELDSPTPGIEAKSDPDRLTKD